MEINKQAWLVVFLKTFIIVLAYLGAYLFRFDLTIPKEYWPHIAHLIVPLILIKLLCFRQMGLRHGWWRYVSLADVIVIFKANVVASMVFTLYVVFVHNMVGLPRSVILLDGVLCFLMICGVRFITRAYRENYLTTPLNRKKKGLSHVLIVGAGAAGQMIAREIRQNPGLKKHIIGYIDDDPSKRGLKFLGSEVLGDRGRIEELLHRMTIDEVILAIPSARSEEIRALYDLCKSLNLRVKTLPGIGEILDGHVSIKEVRDVSLLDLLGRRPVHLDRKLIRSHLAGKRVLVTGAAGSIGSEICRQVAKYEPLCIILVDNAESPLFLIEREMVEKFPDIRLFTIIGDIRDRSRLKAIFDQLMPEVVFHAAAYKHVPMMEHNPAEAIHNNVIGTRNVADIAQMFGVDKFVMISTDKAVNPTNVMGASKRTAELYIQGLSKRADQKTQFVTVRFGNVLGSAGSVIPIFKEQISAGGPVKVTHPDVTRFFMTIPEATQLVLQAGSMGRGGEIFLLDMGEPVKITELAEELIRLSGYEPHRDVKIIYTGLRPGEKLYEELLIKGEGILPTSHNKICVAASVPVNKEWLNDQLEKLYQNARDMDIPSLYRVLQETVPEFTPGNIVANDNLRSSQVIPILKATNQS